MHTVPRRSEGIHEPVEWCLLFRQPPPKDFSVLFCLVFPSWTSSPQPCCLNPANMLCLCRRPCKVIKPLLAHVHAGAWVDMYLSWLVWRIKGLEAKNGRGGGGPATKQKWLCTITLHRISLLHYFKILTSKIPCLKTTNHIMQFLSINMEKKRSETSRFWRVAFP